MKTLKVTIVLLLFAQVVLAQKFSPEQIAEKKVIHLSEKVSLSETQRTEAIALFTANAQQMQALRKNAEANKDAIQSLRKEEREKVKTLLTANQLAQLEELKKVERAARKASNKEIREYHQANVNPVLSEKRKAFENKLTVSEIATIDAARKLRKELKNEIHSKEKSERNKESVQATRSEIRKMLQPIVDNHIAELDQIYQTVKPLLDAEKEFVEAKKVSKHGAIKPGSTSQVDKKIDTKSRFMYRFLLLH